MEEEERESRTRERPPEPPKLPNDHYPLDVATPDERRRWRLAYGIAEQTMGDLGVAQVLPAAWAIYNGPWPT